MGKEILIITHPRNFGSEKIVRTRYVRPPLHVSQDEILHFKHPRVSAVNRIASRPFSDKTNNNKKSILSFDLISMSTLTWMAEKGLEREIKTKGDQFVRRNTEKFYSGGEKKGKC